MESKTVFVCCHCQSDNVQVKAWVNPNDNTIIRTITSELGSCNDCGPSSVIETISVKQDAKIIGFQVVGEMGCPQEGSVHPEMESDSCVYNHSQAMKMIENDMDGTWKLQAVWSDDIENPKIMFNGNIRD